jgi:hypothetical protein
MPPVGRKEKRSCENNRRGRLPRLESAFTLGELHGHNRDSYLISSVKHERGNEHSLTPTTDIPIIHPAAFFLLSGPWNTGGLCCRAASGQRRTRRATVHAQPEAQLMCENRARIGGTLEPMSSEDGETGRYRRRATRTRSGSDASARPCPTTSAWTCVHCDGRQRFSSRHGICSVVSSLQYHAQIGARYC